MKRRGLLIFHNMNRRMLALRNRRMVALCLLPIHSLGAGFATSWLRRLQEPVSIILRASCHRLVSCSTWFSILCCTSLGQRHPGTTATTAYPPTLVAPSSRQCTSSVGVNTCFMFANNALLLLDHTAVGLHFGSQPDVFCCCAASSSFIITPSHWCRASVKIRWGCGRIWGSLA